MEIKRVGKDEDLFLLRSYAFGRTPVSAEDLERFRSSPGNDTVNLVAYDRISGIEPEAAAVVGGIRMRQNVRGLIVPMLGVAGVASHPGARRRGYVRTLMQQLHADMRDQGCITAALYPFRPSFYERYGYAGFPKVRTIELHPQGLRRRELAGSVTLHRADEKDAADEGLRFLQDRLADRHGFATHSGDRPQLADDHWVAFAREDSGTVIGMLQYRSQGLGSELLGRALLSTSALGRALIVQWLGAHADQFSSFSFDLPPDQRPDLWDTDLQYHDRTRIQTPTHSAPMARILSLPGLSGMPAAAAEHVTIEVVEDALVGGTWTFDGTDAAGMQVRPAGSADGPPAATLTSHGLAALVFGTLDPAEIALRGFGSVSPEAAGPLRALFPPAVPYLHIDF